LSSVMYWAAHIGAPMVTDLVEASSVVSLTVLRAMALLLMGHNIAAAPLPSTPKTYFSVNLFLAVLPIRLDGPVFLGNRNHPAYVLFHASAADGSPFVSAA